MRIIRPDAAINDGPQRKIGNVAGHRTVTVILGNDDVGGLFPTELAQPFDMAFARSLGIDCRRMRYIALKSAAHLRAAFEPIAGSIHNVDAAGIHTHVFRDLRYRKRTRPVFPVEIPPE